jgi:aspartate/methionine/tyrosine aminotransferase
VVSYNPGGSKIHLPDFKLERFFAKYEFTAQYLLCSSDCESWSVQEILALEPDASEKFSELWLGYTESPGRATLRQEISRIYETIGPEQVLVHSGAQEAIFLFMHALLNPGDHVIVHWPCYQSLFAVARFLGCEMTLWPAHAETGWAVAVADLKRAIRPHTKLIVLNTPHNPTGYLMPKGEFSELIEIARQHGIFLFSDEVYRELEYSVSDRLPAAGDAYENAVSLGVMSKAYGLAGLRIGWIATRNQAIYDKIAALKDYTTICNSAPGEFLAELALRHRQNLVHRNLGIIRQNLKLLDNFFTENAERFTWAPPKAGAIAFPALRGDAAVFCEALVRKTGVLLLPGTVYDFPGHHFRLGFGRKNLPEGLARLAAFARGYFDFQG